jgi:VanZ family protein
MRHLKFRELIKFWLPVLVWMAVISVGSTDLMSEEHTSRFITPFLRWLKPDISLAVIAQIHFFVRKAGHVTEYAILAALIFRALRGVFRRFRDQALAAFILAALFAGADEFHQSFVASRTSSVGDVGIDSIGAIISLGICGMIYCARPRRTVQR